MSLDSERTIALQPDESGLREALRVLKRHKMMVGIGLLAGLAGSVALVCLLPPKFTAAAVVSVNPRQSDPFVPDNANTQEKLDARSVGTEVVALTSRNLAAQVVTALAIDANAEPGLHQRLCTWQWTPRALCQNVSLTVTESQRVDTFLKQLKVATVKSTDENSWAVSVAYTSNDPELAAKVVNTLIADRQRIEIRQQADEFDRTANWLQQRSDELRSRWMAAQQAVAQFRAAHGLSQTLAGDRMAPLLGQQIASNVTQYGLVQSQLAEAEAKEETLQRAMAAGDNRALIRLPDEPILVDLAKRLDALKLKQALYDSTYRSGVLAPLDHQIAVAEHDLAQEGQRALYQIKAEVAVRRQQAQRMEANLSNLKAQQTAVGAPLAQAESLEKEASDASAVYLSFLTRWKQLADRTPMLEPTTTVLSSATAPDRPSFPEPIRFVAVGLVLGLVAGTGVAWGRDRMGTHVKDISRVGLDFAVPLLSVIPRIHGTHRLGFPVQRYVSERPFSAVAEAVRSLGTAIAMASQNTGPSCSVTIAAALSQEGKSTLCYWLGEVSARGGQSVLLVDGDYRKKTVAARPGLTDVLFGGVSIDSVIVNDNATSMHYLPPGKSRAGAFTAGELTRLRALISELKARYSLVIIDAPPLLGVSEGLIYASIADQTVFLCRWQWTGRAAVANCLNRIQAAGACVTGMVLSMVDMDRMPLYSDEFDRKSIRALRQYYLS